MKLSGNTILITGGGTGIGRALAEQFHARGNTVIITGRRRPPLEAVAAVNPGMHLAQFDVTDPAGIRTFAAQVVEQHPDLNVVVHNAGIMVNEDVQADDALHIAEATIATNLLGPIRLNSALLGQLVRQPRATILTVSSGIAFVPKAGNPSYGATKAAIHSYTQSLRYQLQDTNVQVIEVIPPYVQTELLEPEQATDPMAMPLAAYISETIGILEQDPDVAEVIVERLKPQRFAEARNEYDAFFKRYNDMLSGRVAI